MKTQLTSFVIMCCFGWLSSQTLYKSSIDSGGDNVKVGNTKLLYTIGEVNVQELNVGGTHVSEGFISPLEKIDIIITEIMQNPDAVTNANGEYFEVYNPTKYPINLKGWAIKDDLADATPHIINADLIVPADGFVVLARNSDFATNGNVVVDYEYIDTDLNNTTDAIILEDGETTEVDRTVYDGGILWPNPTGASMVYIGSNIQDNNDGTLWATAEVSEGILPDLGSPGSNGEDQIVNHLVFQNAAWNEVPTPNTGVKNSIVMEDETTTITSDVSVLSLKIRPGADVTVNTGATVTTPSVVLESTSIIYSSLILNGTITDGSSESVVIYNRHVNQNASSGGNDLVTPPVTGEGFDTFIAANPNVVSNGANTLFLFGPFDKTIGDYVTYSNTETVALTAGVGYRAGTTDNESLRFKGSANKESVVMPISNSGPAYQQWNLIGNPYPSYLNVHDFLNFPTNATLLDQNNVAMYGYDGDASDGWTVYNLNTTTPSTLIAPGQGFYVAADNDGPVFFMPYMRRTGTSDDFILGRSSTFENRHLKLQLSTAIDMYNTDFYFNENSTLALDPGYDAGIWGNNAASFSIYSELVNENTGLDMAIQSLPFEDLDTMIIPLGINSNMGEQITVSIAASDLPVSTDVYLEDRDNNTFTLLTTNDFVITPSEALSNTGRFYLRFSSESLSTSENELDDLRIFTTEKPRVLTVSGQLLQDTALKLYDVRGRLVLTQSLNETSLNNTIDVSQLQDGVYVVELNSGYQRKTQKVIIR
ncbi:putative secreted protein (Por secretion system target) [Winogradskyella eximia]|uniref:Putative secreted protein (Por secretion system target) n=1 Tax=Winogradskyella eximia TaxID=262006 RepID=A0A3D9GYU0_9FLAO|nr:lamin tail domain-containing protein [Winogradskyella eximia]RED42122.1 putative secreted protein (Por secretion system target) [Winogradskyella eximia]